MMNGKGDSPRPIQVPAETYADNWDKIFAPKKRKKAKPKKPVKKSGGKKRK